MNEDETHVTLRQWGIMRDRFGWRLVGYQMDSRGNNRLRVSSPVSLVDDTTMVVVTSSGRHYHLEGSEDGVTAIKIIRGHRARFGLTADDAFVVDFDDVVQARSPRGVAH